MSAPTPPPHKLPIPGTRFVVDAFRFASNQPPGTRFFLSHGHSDHYTGITELWKAGDIYCSHVTARLICHLLGVNPQYVHGLDMGAPHVIDGVEVILVDANHCPGAVQFLFKLPDGRKYIHCGDMRYETSLMQDPHLAAFRGATAIYLDTTYCKPKYCFPPQEDSISYVARTVKALLDQGPAPQEEEEEEDNQQQQQQQPEQMQEEEGEEGGPAPAAGVQEQQQPVASAQAAGDSAVPDMGVVPSTLTEQGIQAEPHTKGVPIQGEGPVEGLVTGPVTSATWEGGAQAAECGVAHRQLFLISTYVIGKEKILFAVRESTGLRLYVDERKMGVLRCLGYGDELMARTFTSDPCETPIHVTPWGFLGESWPYFRPNFTNIEEQRAKYKAEQVAGFCCTGWMHEIGKSLRSKGTFPIRTKGPLSIHLVPYSEHSNFAELKEYVRWIRPHKVIPTVNVELGDPEGGKTLKMLRAFESLVDQSTSKAQLLGLFSRKQQQAAGGSSSSPGQARAPRRQQQQEEDAPGQGGSAPQGGPGRAGSLTQEASGGGVDVIDLGSSSSSNSDDDDGGDKGEGQRQQGIKQKEEEEEEQQQGGGGCSVYLGPGGTAAAGAGMVHTTGAGERHPPAAANVTVAAAETSQAAAAVAAGETRQRMRMDSGACEQAGRTDHPMAKAADTAGGKANLMQEQEQQGDPVSPSPMLQQQGAGQAGGQEPRAETNGSATGAKRRAPAPPALATAAAAGSHKRQKVSEAAPTTGRGRAKQQAPPTQQRSIASFFQVGSKPSPGVALPGPASRADSSKATAPGVLPSKAVAQKQAAAHVASSNSRAMAQSSTVLQVVDLISDDDEEQEQGEEGKRGTRAPTPSAPPPGTPPGRVPAHLSPHPPPPAAAGASSAAATLLQPPPPHSAGAGLPVARSPQPGGLVLPPMSAHQNSRRVRGATPPAHHLPSMPLSTAEAQAELELRPGNESVPALSPQTNSGGSLPTTAFTEDLPPESAGAHSILTPAADAGREPLLAAAGCNQGAKQAAAGDDAVMVDVGRQPYGDDQLPMAGQHQEGSGSGEDGPHPAERLASKPAPKAAVSAASFFAPRKRPAAQGQPAGGGKQAGGAVKQERTAQQAGPQLNSKQQGNENGGAEGGGCTSAAARPGRMLGALHGGGAGPQACDVGELFTREAMGLPLAQYDPVRHACWLPGAPTPYLHLALAFALLESTQRRLKIADVLTNMFRSLLALRPQDVVAAVYLTTGRIAPAYEPGGELHVGEATVAAALRDATGVGAARMRTLYRELGDLGDVAQACPRTQSTLVRVPPLTLPGLMESLRGMATDKGQGSAGRRQQTVLRILRACRDEYETKYVVRTLIQNLRIGANWKSVVGPLAKAVTITREGLGRCNKARLDAAAAAASEAYHVCPSWDVLVPALMEHGAEVIRERCAMAPGVPVKPMLARICEGAADALRILGPGAFLAEYKYDGRRAQIHMLADGQVRIFSRNSEDSTRMFPDVVALIREAAGVVAHPTGVSHGTSADAAASGGAQGQGAPTGTTAAGVAPQPPDTSLVLDAEIVGVERDPATGEVTRLAAFQELATRARGEVAVHQVTTAVCVYVFDLLLVHGRTVMHLPLRERRALIPQALPHMRRGHIEVATSKEVLLLPAGAATAGGEGAGANASAAPALWPSSAAAEGTQGQGRQQGRHAGVATVRPLQGEVEVVAPGGGAGAGAEADTAVDPSAGITPDVAEGLLLSLMMDANEAGTEGLMLKRLDGEGAAYAPSQRGDSWVKLKRDYCEGLRDSLDLVVIGAWYGNGRKAGWLSPFLLAAWDPVTETFQSVCRCMSGFTDAFYAAATERLMATQIPGPKPYYNTGERCSLWFEPKEVWELRGADLTLSPVHRGAVGRIPGSDRGVALRFPRFIRVRDDKAVEDASGPDVLVQLYLKQQRRPGGLGGGAGGDPTRAKSSKEAQQAQQQLVEEEAGGQSDAGGHSA